MLGGAVLFLAGVLAAAIVGEACGGRPGAADDAAGDAASGETVTVPADTLAPLPEGLTKDEERVIEVFRRASASIVNVTSVAVRRDPLFFFDISQMPQGSGTGFFWDRDGHVVTNYHVIENGDRFVVTLADGSDFDATVVGAAPEKDLAVLKIDAPRQRLWPLVLGRSRELQVGQRVMALGNPFGWDQTLTVGVISAVGRELRSPAGRVIRDVIQTDAAINPGNSGGPLLDSSGRVIAVTTAIYSPSGASAGIGFAIPSDTVGRLVPQLIQYGRPLEAGIEGIHWLPDQYTRYYRIDGVPVRQVDRGSSAERLGLEGLERTSRGRYALGDVIVEVGGKQVRSVNDVRDAFEQVGSGGDVSLTVDRDGRRRTVKATLEQLGAEGQRPGA